jgi:hypothetical protein
MKIIINLLQLKWKLLGINALFSAKELICLKKSSLNLNDFGARSREIASRFVCSELNVVGKTIKTM